MPVENAAHEFSSPMTASEAQAQKAADEAVTEATGEQREADVNQPSPSWIAQELEREWPRMLLYGTLRQVREQGETWLPRLAGEEGAADDPNSEYYRRLYYRTWLRRYYREAVYDLVGRIFSKPLLLENAPEPIQAVWENVDGRGTHGDIFAHDAAIDSLGQGGDGGVLVNRVSGGPFPSEASEMAAGGQPTWQHYKAHRVIEYLEREVGNSVIAGRVRFRYTETPVKGYNYSEIHHVFEGAMGEPAAAPTERPAEGIVAVPANAPFYSRWRIHTLEGRKWKEGEWRSFLPSRNATDAQRRLFLAPPFVRFSCSPDGLPPLLELAELNHEHYVSRSDITNVEHIACIPTLDGEGLTEENSGQIQVGAYRINFHPENTKLSWLEMKGEGWQHKKDSLKALEAEIRSVSKNPFKQDAVQPERVGVRMADEARPLTLAQVWAMAWLNSLNLCLDLTAAWLGVDWATSTENRRGLFLQKDVMQALANPELFKDVLEMAKMDRISTEGLQETAKTYGRLPSSWNVEEDVARIEAQSEGPLL